MTGTGNVASSLTKASQQLECPRVTVLLVIPFVPRKYCPQLRFITSTMQGILDPPLQSDKMNENPFVLAVRQGPIWTIFCELSFHSYKSFHCESWEKKADPDFGRKGQGSSFCINLIYKAKGKKRLQGFSILHLVSALCSVTQNNTMVTPFNVMCHQVLLKQFISTAHGNRLKFY